MYHVVEIDDLTGSSGAGKLFVTFNLLQWFFQMAIDHDSVDHPASMTTRGLNIMQHLSHDVAGSQGYFARVMLRVIAGLEAV